jgi:signal transduction histidine kinase
VRPRSLTGRIVAAFIVLSVAGWLAIGAAMFVVLRGLHAEATTSLLGDIGQTTTLRFRNAVADRDLRRVMNEIRDEVVASASTVHVIRANGALVGVGNDLPDPVGSVAIPSNAQRGDLVSGSIEYSDGLPHLYAATVLSAPGASGSRAVLLSTVDRSGANALRDVLRSLPIVVLVTLLVGVPLGVLLARSVTGPLRRLAAATSTLPATRRAAFAPLPLDGPTEVRELTDRFNGMSAELGATRERESELLANLRHDLRTPLTVISGFATALTDGTASGDDATRAATAIAEEASRLERLVAELGAIERLRSGSDGLHPEPTDASEVVRAAVQRFGPGAAAAGVTLEHDESSASTLAVDRLALDRIVANLVGNAIAAAGPGGHVLVSARAVASERSGAPAVAFSVTDDGPGFPPGGVDRAFERFYRGDPARTGQGSGLGLAIVLELARAHGGTAHAENLAPRGGRVSVVLPVVPEVAPLAQA